MQSLPIGPDYELPTSARQSSNAFTHPKQCLAALCYATLKAKSTDEASYCWHKGERLQSDLLAADFTDCVVCFKKFAQGMVSCWMWRREMAIWWHQYHAMAFVVGISSGQRQLSPWARKDSLIMSDQMMQKRVNFWNSTQRRSHSQYWHTFSTELFFADRSPSSSTGLVYLMHIFTNIPVIKLEYVFLYFECFFIAWGPHLPIVTSFCCFVKEEGKTRTMEDALIITITLLGWVSETVQDGDFVPFRAMPSQTTPLGNKIILCPVWICILQALKRCHFHCIIQPILVGWKTC